MASISPTAFLGQNPDSYVPGVCNIGPAEIRRRRRAGWVALALGAALLGLLIVVGADRIWYLGLLVPATMAASGFFQAWFRFCAGFGMSALFNFGELGQTSAVHNAVARAKDRRKARTIFAYSVLVGVAAGLLAFALAG